MNGRETKAVLPTLKAAAVYFAIVLGAGFVLGPIRILWAVPRFGQRNAELMEMPIMLLVIIFAALAVRPSLAGRPRDALLVGICALALLIAAELGVVMRLRGLSLGEYIATRDPLSGAAYLAMLGAFAIMPLLMSRR